MNETLACVNVQQEYRGLHDHVVQSYEVDIVWDILRMRTTYSDAFGNNDQALLTFTGLWIHSFESVIHFNMLDVIHTLTAEQFLDGYVGLEKEFDGTDLGSMKNAQELEAYLSKNKLRIFDFTSIMGLCGFVIAKELMVIVKKQD